ncbi:MAG: putative rane protein [Caulobacteraceae bacterium]|nr:putative rane protein [Caulobacteraceae bacterium]
MSASVSIARRRLAGAPDSRFIPTLAWAIAGALVLGAALIMADTLRWVYRAYSPLPWWDQWETISGYMRIRAGGSWWHELVRPHNEHRLVVPRLFFLADLALLGGQNRLLLPMCAGIQLYHAGLLVWLGHRSSSGHSQWTNPVFIASSALAIALLFSFAQMENLFWAFQIAFLGVFAAATTSFLLLTRAVLRQQAGRGWQLSLFAGLALIPIASFTMANGVLAGPIAILL